MKPPIYIIYVYIKDFTQTNTRKSAGACLQTLGLLNEEEKKISPPLVCSSENLRHDPGVFLSAGA